MQESEEKSQNLTRVNSNIKCISQVAPLNIFSNLRHINLSNNKLKVLDTDALKYVPCVSSINLSNNKLRSLGKNLFNHPRLWYINLSKNYLSRIDRDVFNPITPVVMLQLDENILTYENHDMLANLSKLTQLCLSKNHISIIPESAFDENPSITSLNMSFNNLTYLSKNLFKNNKFLKKLVLSGNPLHDIPVNSLPINLQMLNLDNTKISNLGNMLYGLEQLARIYIQNCCLKELTEETFTQNINLTHINASNNQLSYISENIFANQTKIMYINFRNNTIILYNDTEFKFFGTSISDFEEFTNLQTRLKKKIMMNRIKSARN